MRADFIHKNTNRVWEVDFIRGFLVLFMVFDHLMFLIASVFGVHWEYVDFNGIEFYENLFNFAHDYSYGTLRNTAEPYFATLFIFICGLSTIFSKNNFKRGYFLLLVSLLLTYCSYLVLPKYMIHFGVLSLLSFSILIWEFFDRLLNHNKTAMLILEITLAISLVIANYAITENHLPAPNNFCGFLTDEWRTQTHFDSNGDFFALFPNLAIFMIGAFFGNIFYRNKKSYMPKLNCFVTKPINFVGRHALFFYFIPQATFAIILSIISHTAITGTWIIF